MAGFWWRKQKLGPVEATFWGGLWTPLGLRTRYGRNARLCQQCHYGNQWRLHHNHPWQPPIHPISKQCTLSISTGQASSSKSWNCISPCRTSISSTNFYSLHTSKPGHHNSTVCPSSSTNLHPSEHTIHSSTPYPPAYGQQFGYGNHGYSQRTKGGRGHGHNNNQYGQNHIPPQTSIPVYHNVIPSATGHIPPPTIPIVPQRDKPAFSNTNKHFNNWNMCYSCGWDVPHWHTSQTCTNKVLGHQDGCNRQNAEAYLTAGHRVSRKAMHKTALPANPKPHQAWRLGVTVCIADKINNTIVDRLKILLLTLLQKYTSQPPPSSIHT